MSDGLTIRQFHPDDTEALLDLHYRTLRAAGAKIAEGPWEDDLRDIPTFYISNGGDFLVVEADGEVVGMGGLTRLDARTVKLRRMRVEPELQRSGIGRKLLRQLESRARELEIERIILDTSILLIGAQRFYAKHGYLETERRCSGDDTLIYFEKILARPA